MPAFLCRGHGDKNSERTHSPLLPCKFHQEHQEEKNSPSNISQLLPTLLQLLPIPQLAVKSPLLSQLGVKLPCPARQSDFVLSQLIVKTLAVCVSCGFLLGHWGAGQLIPGLERRPSFWGLTFGGFSTMICGLPQFSETLLGGRILSLSVSLSLSISITFLYLCLYFFVPALFEFTILRLQL